MRVDPGSRSAWGLLLPSAFDRRDAQVERIGLPFDNREALIVGADAISKRQHAIGEGLNARFEAFTHDIHVAAQLFAQFGKPLIHTGESPVYRFETGLHLALETIHAQIGRCKPGSHLGAEVVNLPIGDLETGERVGAEVLNLPIGHFKAGSHPGLETVNPLPQQLLAHGAPVSGDRSIVVTGSTSQLRAVNHPAEIRRVLR